VLKLLFFARIAITSVDSQISIVSSLGCFDLT
jgi:hypothetical protein